MRIADRVIYLLQMNGWAEKELGAKLADPELNLKCVEQWQVSRWKLGREKPPRKRILQIEELCYQTILTAFNSPDGFRYICNLSEGYGHEYKNREDDALNRLRRTLTSTCPFPPSGRLQIIVLISDLPEGVRAQCFCSDQNDPRCFVILVPDDAQWSTNVRDEIYAHILPGNMPYFDVKHD